MKKLGLEGSCGLLGKLRGAARWECKAVWVQRKEEAVNGMMGQGHSPQPPLSPDHVWKDMTSRMLSERDFLKEEPGSRALVTWRREV